MVWVKNVVNLKVANSIILCSPSNYITQSKILLETRFVKVFFEVMTTG